MGWVPSRNRKGEWWQMDMGTVGEVTGVVTQARNLRRRSSPQYVKSYKVKVSSDGKAWTGVDGGATFMGNAADGDAKKVNKFATPVKTRYVRIYPESWQGAHIAMRAAIMTP